MNLVDIFFITSIVLFMYLGGKRGFITELRGFTGLLLSLLVAIKFYDVAGAKLFVKYPRFSLSFAHVIAFVIIAIFTRVCVEIGIYFIQKMFSEDTINKINVLVGALLGFIQGFFILGVLTLTLTVFPMGGKIQKIQGSSVLFNHIRNVTVVVVEKIFSLVPQAENGLNSVLHRLEKDKNNSKQIKQEIKKRAKQHANNELQR